MNEEWECLNCSSQNIHALKDTLEYFSDIKIYCMDILCKDCGAKMIGYFEIKKLVKNGCEQ